MEQQKQRRRVGLEDLTPEQREIFADNMRERIYSTITLIAVMTVMWQNNDHRTVIGTIGTIVGSVVSLWLATLISIRMSHRAVHGRAINRQNYINAFFSASGLLAPAFLPIVIIIFGRVADLYSIETALLASIAVSLLSLFGLSFRAGLRIYDNVWRLLFISILEMSVGVLVIVLKLITGE